MTWALLLLALVGVGVYVGLLVQRRVSPPVVPIDSGNHLAGYSTGDAVLLRDVTTVDVARGDVLGCRNGGDTVVGRVEDVVQQGSRTSYRLSGARPGAPLLVPRTEVIGRADRRVPVAGWLLLAARNRIVQLSAGAAVLALGLMIVFGKRAPLAFLEEPPVPIEFEHEALALSAAPATVVTPGRAMTYVEHPMSIKPEDLRQVRFAQQRKGGYDTEAVDRALDTVADSLESIYQERQQLIERLRAAEAEIERYKAMEAQLGQTLAMAERSAEQVKAEARAEADRLLAGAQARAGAAAPTGGPPEGAFVELLGETRAIRSLLQAVLAQSGFAPQQRPPGQ